MKIISTFIHGLGDYAGGIALLLAPNLFGFADVGGAAVLIPRILGVILLLQAITTRYELGFIRMIPMRAHLMNDYVASLFLAVSPWLFGFSDEKANAWMPHLVVGLALFLFSLMTETEPSRAVLGVPPPPGKRRLRGDHSARRSSRLDSAFSPKAAPLRMETIDFLLLVNAVALFAALGVLAVTSARQRRLHRETEELLQRLSAAIPSSTNEGPRQSPLPHRPKERALDNCLGLN